MNLPRGWSVDTLRLHLEARIDAVEKLMLQMFKDQDKAVLAALIAQKEAVAAALAAAEKRLDTMNEFRGQLRDQASTLIPRDEVLALVTGLHAANDALSNQIDKLTARANLNDGRSGGRADGWGWLVGAVSVGVAVVSVVVMLISRT